MSAISTLLEEPWAGSRILVRDLSPMLAIVRDLIFSIDPNHDGKISYEEFLSIMRHIESSLKSQS
jgi:hypothetical protein